MCCRRTTFDGVTLQFETRATQFLALNRLFAAWSEKCFVSLNEIDKLSGSDSRLTSMTCEVLMRQLLQRVDHFIRSEDGPTAVEYAVMLSLIIVVCLVAIGSVGQNTKTSFTNTANSIGS